MNSNYILYYLAISIVIILMFIIIALIIYHIFSLHINNKTDANKKTIFDTHITNISKESMKDMLSLPDDKKWNVMIGNKTLDNALQLNCYIGKINIKTLLKSNIVNESREIQTEILTLSQLLNTNTYDKNINKYYYDRMKLSTHINFAIKDFCKKSIIFPQKKATTHHIIIHEIINHLHFNGYEQLGYKTLNNILNTKQHITHIINIDNKKIQLIPTDVQNKMKVNVFTKMSIAKVESPNIKHTINTTFSFYISYTNSPEYNKSISYKDTSFTLCIPKKLAHYISTKSIIKNLTEEPDYAILESKKKRFNKYIIRYKLPNLSSNILLTKQNHTDFIKENTNNITIQPKPLSLRIYKDNISYFITNKV